LEGLIDKEKELYSGIIMKKNIVDPIHTIKRFYGLETQINKPIEIFNEKISFVTSYRTLKLILDLTNFNKRKIDYKEYPFSIFDRFDNEKRSIDSIDIKNPPEFIVMSTNGEFSLNAKLSNTTNTMIIPTYFYDRNNNRYELSCGTMFDILNKTLNISTSGSFYSFNYCGNKFYHNGTRIEELDKQENKRRVLDLDGVFLRITGNRNIEDNRLRFVWAIYVLENKTQGGAIKQKIFKATKERVVIGNRQMVVYVGARNGKYIRRNGSYVSLASIRHSMVL
jgi:hypothetical protein